VFSPHCHLAHAANLKFRLTFHTNGSQRLLYEVKLLFFIVLGMFMMVDKITLWIEPKISTPSIKVYAVVSEPCVRGRVT
jgi:hypothetical protein